MRKKLMYHSCLNKSALQKNITTPTLNIRQQTQISNPINSREDNISNINYYNTTTLFNKRNINLNYNHPKPLNNSNMNINSNPKANFQHSLQ